MVDDILRYDLYHDDEISDAVVQQASELFSEHYGVWSKQAPGKMGGRVRAGMLSASSTSSCLVVSTSLPPALLPLIYRKLIHAFSPPCSNQQQASHQYKFRRSSPPLSHPPPHGMPPPPVSRGPQNNTLPRRPPQQPTHRPPLRHILARHSALRLRRLRPTPTVSSMLGHAAGCPQRLPSARDRLVAFGPSSRGC